MITLLSSLFIRNKDAMSERKLREAYGTLCSAFGIFLNILLFALKYFAGTISGSIAITADAFNNLSDAGSSLITLIGLKLGGKAPDPEHPFGHGRIEYLSGLAVSVIIVVVGVELFRSSLDKILHPEAIETGKVAIIVLVASILIKGYMFFYNRRIGTKINSSGMKATAMDSISDVVATSVVLIATIAANFTDLPIDGWCGLLVSLFIIYAGLKSVKETVSPLLGGPPDKEFVEEIEKLVMSYEKIIGIHDLVVHDYGPGRIMVSLHAEVSGNENIFVLHDIIDNAEHALSREFGCIAVIHMDPIETDDNVTAQKRFLVADAVKTIDSAITIHDFRMVPGVSHTNLIFDAVVPYSLKMSDSEIKQEISRIVGEKCENCHVVVNIDRPFV